MESYHPKRKRNEIIDNNEIDEIIERGNHVTIALSNNDIPYIVTLSYGYDKANECLYFHCANRGDKLDYIEKNKNACATIIEDHGYLKTRCDHDYASIILRGRMEVVNEINEKKHGLQILLNHLEEDPEPVFERNIKDDRSYDGFTILRFRISSKIGKKYIEK